jgi:hypothetical protein
MLPNFRATGFTASLYHKISLLKRVLEFQNEPDRMKSLVFDSQRQTRKPAPRTSELKMRAEILLNEILSEMIAQVIEGYRAYSDLKLSPEVYIDDLQNGSLDPDSRTAKYLLVSDPALRIALIYPPKPIGLKPD